MTEAFRWRLAGRLLLLLSLWNYLVKYWQPWLAAAGAAQALICEAFALWCNRRRGSYVRVRELNVLLGALTSSVVCLITSERNVHRPCCAAPPGCLPFAWCVPFAARCPLQHALLQPLVHLHQLLRPCCPHPAWHAPAATHSPFTADVTGAHGGSVLAVLAILALGNTTFFTALHALTARLLVPWNAVALPLHAALIVSARADFFLPVLSRA